MRVAVNSEYIYINIYTLIYLLSVVRYKILTLNSKFVFLFSRLSLVEDGFRFSSGFAKFGP